MLRPLINPLNLRQRLVKRLLVTVGVSVLVLIVLLPAIVTEVIRYQVPRMGMGRVEIGNIDINLFRGKVQLEEVGLYRAAAQLLYLERAELDLGILSLLQRRIHIQELSLQGLALTIEQRPNEPLKLAGIPLPPTREGEPPAVAAEPSEPWSFGIDAMSLRDGSVQVIHPKFTDTVSLQSLSLGALAMWRPDYVTPFSINLALQDGTLGIQGKTSPFRAEPTADATLNIASFALSPLSRLAEPYLASVSGTLSAQMALQFTQNREGMLSLKQDGKLTLLDTRLQYEDADFRQQGLYWNGVVSSANLLETDQLEVGGDLKLSGLAVRSGTNDDPSMALQSLSLTQLRLAGLRELSVAEVAIDSVMAQIQRRSDGITILGIPSPAAPAEGGNKVSTAAPAAEGGAAAATPFHFNVGRVVLSGSNRIGFDDQAVKPAFKHGIVITEGEFKGIDNNRSQQPVTVFIKGKDDYYTQFMVEGEVKPFAPQLALNLKTTLDNYDMPPVSPYLAKLIGYRITTGQLDTRVAMKIENNAMDGNVELHMNQLKLEEEDPARIENLQSKTSMPVNTALSLLRDKNDNIKLTLPISGKLDDPQFDFSDIINTALGKALKSASVSYLKFLLQPYGSLISVMQLAGKAAGHIQLEPVTYPVGSAAVDAAATPYLEKIGQLLQQKPINVRLCGFATAADLAIISKGKLKQIPPEGHPALEALAKQRSESIKAVLVNDYGISPKRVFVCHPELDRSADGTARTELSI